jgi:hypothetical protein
MRPKRPQADPSREATPRGRRRRPVCKLALRRSNERSGHQSRLRARDLRAGAGGRRRASWRTANLVQSSAPAPKARRKTREGEIGRAVVGFSVACLYPIRDARRRRALPRLPFESVFCLARKTATREHGATFAMPRVACSDYATDREPGATKACQLTVCTTRSSNPSWVGSGPNLNGLAEQMEEQIAICSSDTGGSDELYGSLKK